VLAVLFIAILLVTWVPRNWQFLLGTHWSVFFDVIGLGVFGFMAGYAFSSLLKQNARDSQTIALEIGIQNGPLALAIVVFTFSGPIQQSIMAVPALYSLFIVLTATALTVWFRLVNDAAEQKTPASLL
jgi:BASS family bile acid:Na+ symporter